MELLHLTEKYQRIEADIEYLLSSMEQLEHESNFDSSPQHQLTIAGQDALIIELRKRKE